MDEETGYRRGFGFVLAGWGGVLLEQDRLPEARAKLEAALKVRQEMGSPSTVGDSLLALAKLALEEGNAAEAEKLARDSETQFASVKEPGDEASATAILVQSLLAQGKLLAAQSLARQDLSRKINALPSRFDISLASALVQAALGDRIASEKQLEEVIARARKSHFMGYEFEARLELGRVLMKSGQVSVAMDKLSSLERDAKENGYVLIADKAAARGQRTATPK